MAEDIEIKGHVLRELQSPTGRITVFYCLLCKGTYKRHHGVLGEPWHADKVRIWSDDTLPACTFVRVRVAP